MKGMKLLYCLLLFFVLIGCLPVYADTEEKNTCEYFFLSLESKPHEELTHRNGEYQSLLDGKKHTGCEIKFVTNDILLSGIKVPDFTPVEGSEMYRNGWRVNNSFSADGPGTSLLGVQKKTVLCLVGYNQPAYLDDQGNIIQSETLSITVQCRNR